MLPLRSLRFRRVAPPTNQQAGAAPSDLLETVLEDPDSHPTGGEKMHRAYRGMSMPFNQAGAGRGCAAQDPGGLR